MGKVLRRVRTRSALAAMMAIGLVPLAGQAYRAPRGPDAKPDLNGIWQALNEANYDIEAHVARSAMALRPAPYGPVPAAAVLALGAVGAVPPSLGALSIMPVGILFRLFRNVHHRAFWTQQLAVA